MDYCSLVNGIEGLKTERPYSYDCRILQKRQSGQSQLFRRFIHLPFNVKNISISIQKFYMPKYPGRRTLILNPKICLFPFSASDCHCLFNIQGLFQLLYSEENNHCESSKLVIYIHTFDFDELFDITDEGLDVCLSLGNSALLIS